MMGFFNLNFINVQNIFAQKISKNVHAIFCQFSDIKNEGQSQNNQASSVSRLLLNPNALKLAVLGKANLLMNKFI